MKEVLSFWLVCTVLISFGFTYYCPVGKQDLLTEWRTDVEVWKLSAWIATWLAVLFGLYKIAAASLS